VTIPVAIKQLDQDADWQRRSAHVVVSAPVEVWTALNHQNLVFLYGVVLKPSLLLVMEHVSRGSLLDVLQAADHRIDWVRALAWVADVALGTSALHEHSPPVYHRDLKPSNVLVDEHWRLKIADFDTARLLESENFATFEGKMVGSPGYLPPEMMQGGTFTAKGDVYSIGIMLNELAVRVITGSARRAVHRLRPAQSRGRHGRADLRVERQAGTAVDAVQYCRRCFARWSRTAGTTTSMCGRRARSCRSDSSRWWPTSRRIEPIGRRHVMESDKMYEEEDESNRTCQFNLSSRPGHRSAATHVMCGEPAICKRSTILNNSLKAVVVYYLTKRCQANVATPCSAPCRNG
jgi:hypothetical protein